MKFRQNLVIALASMAPGCAIAAFGSAWISPQPDLRLAIALLVGSLLMFALGWLDDLKHFRPATKLIVQIVAASVFIASGGVFPLSEFAVLNMLITYFWFLGITNAVNMLDNMDGLASGIVAIAAGTIVALSWMIQRESGIPLLSVPIGLILLSVVLGFWFHNKPPAQIFMGDSGSLSIGFVLAAIAAPTSLNGFLGISNSTNAFAPLLSLIIPVSVLAIPIFDTTLVTLTRKWRSQKVSQGGRDHSSHRLVLLGFSEKQTVWTLYGLGLFGGLTAVVMLHYSNYTIPAFGVFVVAMILAGTYLGHVKIKDIDLRTPPPLWTPIVTEILFKRRAAEVILDVILIVVAFYLSYLLRFDGSLPKETAEAISTSLPAVVACSVLSLLMAGIYRGQWRLISVQDVPAYGVGVSLAVALSFSAVALITQFDQGHSRSAYLIFGALLLLSLLGSRLSFRILDNFVSRRTVVNQSPESLAVLIYGAGSAGKLLFDIALHAPAMRGMRIVGFVDDNTDVFNKRLCGLPVRSTSKWENASNRGAHVGEIWISSQSISDGQALQFAKRLSECPTVKRFNLNLDDVKEMTESTEIVAK